MSPECGCKLHDRINFLDSEFRLEEGKLVTDLYRRPTVRNQYLLLSLFTRPQYRQHIGTCCCCVMYIVPALAAGIIFLSLTTTLSQTLGRNLVEGDDLHPAGGEGELAKVGHVVPLAVKQLQHRDFIFVKYDWELSCSCMIG